VAAEHEVYLEVGTKRVFAGSTEWPGWVRGGRDKDAALEALAGYGPRYAAALGRAAREFTPPGDASALRVVQRLIGGASTDFGAPEATPAADRLALDAAELKRQVAILKACWASFDRTAVAAEGAVLTKGPRGGGRDLDAIILHVFEAEQAYLYRLGGKFRKGEADLPSKKDSLRKQVVDLLGSRTRGEPVEMGRRTAALWTPRYFVRRSAWHVLDHAWEIEDRATHSR
jgi:hypothetical protein